MMCGAVVMRKNVTEKSTEKTPWPLKTKIQPDRTLNSTTCNIIPKKVARKKTHSMKSKKVDGGC